MTAPLFDQIVLGCYNDMASYLKTREKVLNKELNSYKNKEEKFIERMDKLDPTFKDK